MNREIICNNCGHVGHQANDCKLPIISMGVIAYRINPNSKLREYLMICRKDSFGFSDFLYTKPYMYNDLYMQDVVDEMTSFEKTKIIECLNVYNIADTSNNISKENEETNEECDLKETLLYKKVECFENFVKENNFNFNLRSLINNSFTNWEECEWGFPKGRRNLYEKDLNCALREFEEETGYKKEYLTIIENIAPFEEIYIGSNNKCYKHKYFLGFMEYEETLNTNMFQETEVSNLEWKSYNSSILCIRPYNYEKKIVLQNVNKCLDIHKII